MAVGARIATSRVGGVYFEGRVLLDGSHTPPISLSNLRLGEGRALKRCGELGAKVAQRNLECGAAPLILVADGVIDACVIRLQRKLLVCGEANT